MGQPLGRRIPTVRGSSSCQFPWALKGATGQGGRWEGHTISSMGARLDNGTVATWNSESGWGSVAIEDSGVLCFAHFSCIAQHGQECLELVPGEHVRLIWHEAQQDGFSAVADRVERANYLKERQ